MMKHFKKVLSILCAIALLATSMTLALAEETDAQPAVVPAAEEAAAPAEPAAAPAEAAPAQAEPTVVEASVVNAPAAETAPVEDKEPAAAEEPTMIEAPADDTPAQVQAEQEEPAQAQAVQEEPAQAQAEQEEPQQEEPAEEQPEQEETEQEEESAQDSSEEEQADEQSEEDDELEEIDDWGYVDPEVIEANVPEITDELKGLRSAELNVGAVLADTINFGEELAVTLNASDASTVELKLYLAPGPAVNTKIEGKAVSFTPAHSDVPYLNLYTYELTNASGRSFEIVLSSNDTVSFQLAAVEKLSDEIIEEEISAQDVELSLEEVPAEETPAEDIPADETVETLVPSIQASVKTYNALKVGSSISDMLVAGQKAKLQVKCGKNPSVTLILQANPDDLTITMDGNAAQFTPAGDGTYTCELENVAFRKFNVIIGAKQDLTFSLSAVAASDEMVEGEEEEDEEAAEVAENNDAEEDTIIVEETEEEVEVAKETEEKVEKEEETEEINEEAEISEKAVEGEEAEDVEDNTEKEIKENEEITEDLNAEEEIAEETEVELAVLLNDEHIEELGFRKVQILNENGTDIYTVPGDEGAVIDHLDLGAEIWIKDTEIEGWALVYTIDETEQYVKLAEIDKQPLTDEQMLEMGYIKVYVGIDIGANIYSSIDGDAVVDHMDVGTEMWVMLINGADRAQIFQEDEEAPARYINLVDIIATLKPVGMEELPTRELVIHSNLENMVVLLNGTTAELTTELFNFTENDVYEVNWSYSKDGEEFFDIDGANDLVFTYVVDEDNAFNIWRVTVVLKTVEE